jgi:hypothetical protein
MDSEDLGLFFSLLVLLPLELHRVKQEQARAGKSRQQQGLFGVSAVEIEEALKEVKKFGSERCSVSQRQKSWKF